jgi:hypothetical protein
MFEPLEKLLKNVKKANVNELSLSVFIIPEIKNFIIRLNLVDQLYTEGLDVNDKIIGTYAYTTAISKGEDHFIYNGLVSVKKFGEPYTLFDSGEFYESFKVIFQKDGFVISANTVKHEKLSEKMLPFLQKSLREYLLS